MENAFPHPLDPSTTIEIDFARTTQVTLKIFNPPGEELATLVSDRLNAGTYCYYRSRPAGMASGIYLYRLFTGSLAGEAGEFVETMKMVFMR